MGLFVLDDKWKARLEQMWAWQRGFTATGDGVSFKNPSTGGPSIIVIQKTARPSSSPSNFLFPVKLTQSGGANGTKTTAATWTYVVKDLGDNVLYNSDTTKLDTSWPRPSGTMTAATIGHGWYDATGALKIVAYEKPGTASC